MSIGVARGPQSCRSKKYIKYRLFGASYLLLIVFLSKRYTKMSFALFLVFSGYAYTGEHSPGVQNIVREEQSICSPVRN